APRTPDGGGQVRRRVPLLDGRVFVPESQLRGGRRRLRPSVERFSQFGPTPGRESGRGFCPVQTGRPGANDRSAQPAERVISAGGAKSIGRRSDGARLFAPRRGL